MGLFDKIRNTLSGNNDAVPQKEFEKVIHDTWQEHSAKHDHFFNVPLNSSNAWTGGIKDWPDKKKVQFILWLIPAIHHYLEDRHVWNGHEKKQQQHATRVAYLQFMLRGKLVMDEEGVANIYEAFSKHKLDSPPFLRNWPFNLLLNQIEKRYLNQSFGELLEKTLSQLKEHINSPKNNYPEKERIKMAEKIDAILFANENKTAVIKPARFMGDDAFAEMANAAIGKMPEQEKLGWYALLPLAQKATGAQPSRKYLDDTKGMVRDLGAEKFKKTVHDWFYFLTNLKDYEREYSTTYRDRTYTHTAVEFLSSVNADAVKGLVWACAHFHDQVTIRAISALAERAFRKIPGKGPAALSLGNACLYVLYKSKGLDGIGQLSRLKLRIKQASTQGLIDKYLDAAAKEQGVTVGEVEDMAVDDCGLINKTRCFLFDDYKAELVITGVGKTEIKWFKPDGTQQKSAPATVKEKHAAKLKKLKEAAKHIEQTLTAQRDRLDRMFRSGRELPWENFEQYYLQHGLMCYLTHGIIWNFHQNGGTVQAIYFNGQWVNAIDKTVAISGTEKVSLWHPVQASVSEIKAWRDFLVSHQLLQPLKQAYREVYLLTEAELNTKIYSNRMAAHILRQHEFNSLAKARGWRYTLMGAYDKGYESDKASLTLPDHQLRAEYWISEVNSENDMSDSGIWNYVSTDQVRFIDTNSGEAVDLADVHPLVFSEVMRDVDLFVGVASVGNDPVWRDSGGLPGHHDYWTRYSFGELSELANSRKQVLADLVPRLKIRDVATIKDKFLIVKGKLRTYKIHIGSTNILMEPNDQYLCIVPDRGQKNHTENLFLPFEGDNGLSIILSKAFLLADDDKITDTTIISQIKHR